MTCTVVGCSAPLSCRGWCTQHYNLNDPPMNQIPEELFTERMRLLP